MKKLISLSICFFGTIGFLHSQFSDYKYVVVPIKFAVFKNPNQHQTSTMVKYHIAKNGFNVIYDNAIPEDLIKDRCLGLWVDLVDNSSLLTTKVQLDFKDCYGESIFMTKEGKTKIKEYKGAYSDAITRAASSLNGKEHNYVAKKTRKTSSATTPVVTSTTTKVEQVKEVMIKPPPVEVVAEDKQKLEEDTIHHSKEEAVSNVPEVEIKKGGPTAKNDLLYAQPTANGYQLVDTTPAVRYVLEATSVDDVFLVNQNDINGVVLKKDGKWYLEYKGPKGKVSKELLIKF